MLATTAIHDEHAAVVEAQLSHVVDAITADPATQQKVEQALGPGWIGILTTAWQVFGPFLLALIQKRFGITLPTTPPPTGQVMN